MIKLTLSKLTPLLLLLVLFACGTVVKSPGNTSDYDATAVSNVNEASSDDVSSQDAGNDSQLDAVVASVEDASVDVKVDTMPIFIDYIHTAMKSWLPPKDQCLCSGTACTLHEGSDQDADHVKYQACIDNADSFYKEIATTIVEVVSESDIVFPFIGDNIKVKVALLAAAIARYEGRYERRVDTCQKTGDNGIAFGLWQTHTPRATTCNDRKSALHHALRIVNISFDKCRRSPFADRLAAYASGNCEHGIGNSRLKINKAIDYLRAHPYTEE